MDQATVIKVALDKISDQVHVEVGELKARLLAAEQLIASGGRSDRGFSSADSIGTRAAGALAEDQAFMLAASSAARGMKTSPLVARVNVDGGLRAALVGEGGSSTGASSTVPGAPSRGVMVGQAQRPLTLLDVLPSRPVTGDAVESIRIHTSSDADYQLEHGAAKKELDFEGDPIRSEIATVAGWTAASRQVLADHVALQATVDRVIRGKVLSKLEREIVRGAGGPGEIDGLWSIATPFVPSSSVHAENRADRIGEALMVMDAAGYSPSIVVLHPEDWFRLLVTKDQDDGYLFGSPSAPLAPSLWSRTVVTSSSLEIGDGLVIDPAHVTILDREQLSVQVSNQHADFFTRNLVAILAELRAGLEVTDALAVLKFDFDGIAASEA